MLLGDAREKAVIEMLHDKFRSLTSVVELVSAINNGGHPTLRSTDIDFPRSDPGLDNALYASADILVRNEEVAAVAVSGSGIVAMQTQSEDSGMTEAMDNPDSADEEKPDDAGHDETDFEEFDYSNIAGISAIVNPQSEDKDTYEFPDGCQCILVPKGKSHLPTTQLSPDKLCRYFLKKIK